MENIHFNVPVYTFSTRDECLATLRRARDCFESSLSFLEANALPLPQVTPQERMEALKIYHEAPDAPSAPSTPATAMLLNKMLTKFDYDMGDPKAKMRNYVMFKFFELAENDDPKVSMRALENLAKTSDVGLFSERVEVSISSKDTDTLEKDVGRLVAGILNRKNKPVVADGEFIEL